MLERFTGGPYTLRFRFDDEGISLSWGILFRREIQLTYREAPSAARSCRSPGEVKDELRGNG